MVRCRRRAELRYVASFEQNLALGLSREDKVRCEDAGCGREQRWEESEANN